MSENECCQPPKPPLNEEEHNQKAACGCPCASNPWRWLIIAAIVVVVVVIFTRNSHNGPQSDTSSITQSETGSVKQSNAGGINWSNNYQGALAEAQKQNKPVLLAFHADWCGYCNKMKKTTYHDPAVINAFKKIIPIMINTDKQGDVAKKYRVGPIPAYVVLGPDGTVIGDFIGFQSPKDFIAEINKALKKINVTI